MKVFDWLQFNAPRYLHQSVNQGPRSTNYHPRPVTHTFDIVVVKYECAPVNPIRLSISLVLLIETLNLKIVRKSGVLNLDLSC